MQSIDAECFTHDQLVRLRTRWLALSRRLCASGDGGGLFDRLFHAYFVPPRAYYNINHIEECLDVLLWLKDLPHDEDAVKTAIWFHDAVYDAKRHNNEERSCAFAMDELARLGAGTSLITKVQRLILATRHVELPTDEDERVIVDVDLAILGAPPARFDEYERKIRSEYAHVPDEAFRVGRMKVLQAFLARSTIYSTDRMRKDFEDQARRNLGRSIERLTGHRELE